MTLKYLPILALLAACKFAPQPVCPPCVCPCDTTVVVVPPVIDTDTTFKVGVNSFPWFPMRLLNENGIKWARVYVSNGWWWQPGGFAGQPLHQAETVENHGIDDLLIKARQYGVNVLLCVHQTPEFFRNTGRNDGANDFAPIPAGAKRDDPASYRDYASFLFQVAARYGRVKHPDNVLRVDTKPRWSGDILNEKKTGLDLLTYLEPWNETDKFWLKGTEAYFEPEETAAMMSAVYDGHEGALGAGVGIITADPSMQVSMPGITDFNMDYINRMHAWFLANRKDKKWPCSILQAHHYSNKGNQKNQIPAQWVNDGACLPADDKNFSSINDFVAFAKSQNLPLIIGEFGADKVPPSQMLAKGVGKSNEQFQSEIILESVKAYRKAKVNGVFIFTGPDDYGAGDGGQFETCGLFSNEATGYRPFIAATGVKAYLASTVQASPYAKLQSVEYYKELDRYKKVSAAASKRPN